MIFSSVFILGLSNHTFCGIIFFEPTIYGACCRYVECAAAAQNAVLRVCLYDRDYLGKESAVWNQM